MPRVPLRRTHIWQPKSNAPDSGHSAKVLHVRAALRTGRDDRFSFSKGPNRLPRSLLLNERDAAVRGGQIPSNLGVNPARLHPPEPGKSWIRRCCPRRAHNKPAPALEVLLRCVRCERTLLLSFSTYESTSLRFFQSRLQEVTMQLLEI